jgi:hypothetical protein
LATDELINRNPPAEYVPFQITHLLGLIGAVGLAGFSQWLFHGGVARTLLPALIGCPTLYWLGFAVSAVIEGSLLFVSAVLWAWPRRYLLHDFWEPGHSMALRGAAVWAFFVLNYGAYKLALSTSFRVAPRLLAFLQIAAFIGFTLWFLWLALLSKETRSWRRAYAVLAIAPALGIAASFANMISRSGLGPPRSLRLTFLTHAIVALVQGIAVIEAVTNDTRRTLPRHWSHWIAVIASLGGFVLTVGAGFWMAIRVPR